MKNPPPTPGITQTWFEPLRLTARLDGPPLVEGTIAVDTGPIFASSVQIRGKVSDGVNGPRGLIVNGHVPVKIEAGESPLKRSGKAITIDGAFSEAYGDHGYTLVLESDRTLLAKHHHFDSVEAAIRDGVAKPLGLETLRAAWGVHDIVKGGPARGEPFRLDRPRRGLGRSPA